MKKYKIFVINPGSTSTKLSLFTDEEELFTTDVFHDSSILKTFGHINDQLDYRMQVVEDFIKDNGIDLTDLDAIACRGGASYSVESGTYEVDERLIKDTKEAKGGLYHSSMLGVQMGKRLSDRYGARIFMSDPTVTDEYDDIARVTGIDGIYRKAISHALNQKAVAKMYAKEVGKDYEKLDLIVAHIDGGISICAHHHGRMIDGNDGGGGDGPFTPTRMGSMAVTDVVEYLWDKSKEEMKDLCSVSGGFSDHFKTSNSDKVYELYKKGDDKAKRVFDAMIYQVAKCIGAMATVLKGHVDQIILTGGLLRFEEISKMLDERCSFIAPIRVYKGEYEQRALASRALEVLRGEKQAKRYSGKPVFEGFKE